MSVPSEEQAQSQYENDDSSANVKAGPSAASEPAQEHVNQASDRSDKSDADLTESADASIVHLTTSAMHFTKFWHSYERERQHTIENKIEAEQRRVADLERTLQKVTDDKEHVQTEHTSMRVERDEAKERLKELTAAQTSALETLGSLRQELADANSLLASERNGRLAILETYAEKEKQQQATLQQTRLELATCQGDLRAAKQESERLEADKRLLGEQLRAAQKAFAQQQSNFEESQFQLSQRETELARLRPIARHHEAIVYVWQTMLLKGKIQVARELLEPESNHPYYAQLEAAPELMDACARRAGVQEWLAADRTDFRNALKHFPVHLKDAFTSEEVVAGEVLREFQAHINTLLKKADIRVISPEPGEPINPNEHDVEAEGNARGGHAGTVLQCLCNGYSYKDILIRATVQPTPLGAKAPLAAEAAEATAEQTPTEEQAGVSSAPSGSDSADVKWHSRLALRGRQCPEDSNVRQAMEAFETLISKARENAAAPIPPDTLKPTLETLAPLFTHDYPVVHDEQWRNTWLDVWAQAKQWMRDALDLESFRPEENSPFDPATMVWDAANADRQPDQSMRIERTTIVGFRGYTSQQTVLKATVATHTRRRN